MHTVLNVYVQRSIERFIYPEKNRVSNRGFALTNMRAKESKEVYV